MPLLNFSNRKFFPCLIGVKVAFEIGRAGDIGFIGGVGGVLIEVNTLTDHLYQLRI